MPSGVHSCVGSSSPQALIKADYYENGRHPLYVPDCPSGSLGWKTSLHRGYVSLMGKSFKCHTRKWKHWTEGTSKWHVEKKSRKHRSGPGTSKTLETFQNFNNFLTFASSLTFLLSFPLAQILKPLKQNCVCWESNGWSQGEAAWERKEIWRSKVSAAVWGRAGGYLEGPGDSSLGC